MRVGEIEIVPLRDGEMRFAATLLYPRTTEADWEAHDRWLNDDGTLDTPVVCFLVRTGGRAVLVDTGLGTLDVQGMRGGALLDELAAAGARPEDVTDVVFSHLHFDHVGWATQHGEVVFPRAVYRCARADWSHFVDETHEAERKLAPIAGRLEPWDGAATIAPGLDVMPTPGHTPGHSAFVVSSGAERAILLGDAAHCPIELEQNEWDGIGDVDPEAARRMRAQVSAMLESSGTAAAGAHFPELAFGRLVRGEGRLRWVFS